MEVKPGYKQSEVGVIPEEWGISSLGELVDQSRKITYGIVVPGPATHNGVPMIRAQDYSKGWVDLDDLYRVSHTIDKAYKRSKVITGDVLLTIVGSVGNLAKVPRTFDGSNITQQTARLSFNPKVADADYYFNALLADVGRQAIANFTKSGVQPSLNLSDVEKFILPQPPLPEQRAIATALSDVDGLLGGLDRLIAKKRDLKQAAMQQLLTSQTRLPGFEIETGTQQTELGKFPMDWAVKQIRNVCRLINGRGFKPHEWQTTGLPIIRIQNLNGSEDFNYYSGQYDSKILVEHGQLLFAWSGSRGTSFGPHVWRGGKALLNYHTWKVVINESCVDPGFLVHAFRQITTYIEDRAHGASALVHTQKWEMEKFPIAIPLSIREQTAISEVLTEMDAELAGLEQRREKTRALKQGMMQELLTGRTRLV
jgi:restriction endonuclease S subunit